MSLIVSSSEGASPEQFPKLVYGMIFEKKQIILATGRKAGGNTLIGTNINGIGHPIGFYSDSWDSAMKDWSGDVTIKS